VSVEAGVAGGDGAVAAFLVERHATTLPPRTDLLWRESDATGGGASCASRYTFGARPGAERGAGYRLDDNP
jgi:hypothetical protein